VVETIRVESPRRREVMLEMAACGVCHSDLSIANGQPRQDFDGILSLYRSGKLELDELITRTYRIEEAPAAFRDLVAGRNARGVILF
jgi:Zn-dependent alcohol dehydrogenase